VNPGATEEVVIYRTSEDSTTWTRVDAQISGGTASFDTEEGGVYVAAGHTKAGVIAGAVIGALAVVAIIVIATVLYARKNPEKLSSLRHTFASKV